MSKLLVSAPIILSLALAGSGCGLEPEEDGVEQVRLNISVVPAEVRCVRITATGPGRTLVRELEATGGMSLSRPLTGLPLGTVTFLGEAFPSLCASVTKSTNAAWISEPVVASVALGRSSTVDLTMVRNGRAKVDVAFTEEPACTAPGGACLSNAECCSGKCVQKACAAEATPPMDGVAPGGVSTAAM